MYPIIKTKKDQYFEIFMEVFSGPDLSSAFSIIHDFYTSQHNPSCVMYIRPDGHGASFSAEVTAEEAVYTLRRMLGNPFWCEKKWRKMLYSHLEMTEKEAGLRLNKEYRKDIAMFGQIETEAMDMADDISAGIICQFLCK